MSKIINFYYGMSGSLKHTTISSNINSIKESYPTFNLGIMWSSIKPWKKYERILSQDQDDLNYANLHLCRLIDYLSNDDSDSYLLVERGITDMLYYHMKNTNKNLNKEWVSKVVNEETSLFEKNSYVSSKILLIQEDIDFIKDVIFKEPTRVKEFPGGIQDYLNNQDKYVKFTKLYNKIDKEIVIKDARKYIERDLGLEFNPMIR